MVPWIPMGFELLLYVTQEQAENLKSRIKNIAPEARTGYWQPIKMEAGTGLGFWDRLDVKLFNYKADRKIRKMERRVKSGKFVHNFSIMLDKGFEPELMKQYHDIQQLLDVNHIKLQERRMLDGMCAIPYKKEEDFLKDLEYCINNGGPKSPYLI